MSAADHLRAHARAIRAEAEARACALDAIADDLDRGSDVLLDAAQVEAGYPFSFRVVTDAAKRGEVTIEYAGRKPLVRRSTLEAWMSARASKPTIAKVAANDSTDERADARASIARAAARMGSR